MNIVEIRQDDVNGFVTSMPAEVKVIPVATVEVAQVALRELLKKRFAEFDVEVEPVVDDKNYLSIDNNEPVEGAYDDHYTLCTLKGPDSSVPVADLFIEESPVQITWFLVD